MIEIIVCQLLDLFAKKKLFVNLFYLIGTTVFVLLTLNTANDLSVVRVMAPATVQATLDDRSAELKNSCDHTQILPKEALTDLFRRSHVLNHLGFLLRCRSLFYCSVPKVATRTFLLFLTYLHVRDEILRGPTKSNETSTTDYNADYLQNLLQPLKKNESVLATFLGRLQSHNQINASPLDLWLMYQKEAFPSVRLRTLADPTILFSPSFQRVIFVRHPLERLASAYIDKIATLKGLPGSLYDDLRRKVCRKYASAYLTVEEQHFYRRHRHGMVDFQEPCARKIPSFEHFVDYLISGSAQHDVHWEPYSSLCQACLFKYNFIGKYETIEDDLSRLLTRVGLTVKEWNRNNPYSTGRTKHSYQLMYSSLSDRTLCFLKSFYQQDFKLFKYRFDDYLLQPRPLNCSRDHYRSLL